MAAASAAWSPADAKRNLDLPGKGNSKRMKVREGIVLDGPMSYFLFFLSAFVSLPAMGQAELKPLVVGAKSGEVRMLDRAFSQEAVSPSGRYAVYAP